VQETYLRAWRSFGGFEGRSSPRTWLYRIATNRCLTALERRERRPMPSGLGGPADDPGVPLASGPEVAWLQPLPDARTGAAPADPAVIVEGRDSVRLALVAAMQHLSARQRAVLVLREVLAWRAAEAAEVLGMTPTAVNSALQHARARLVPASANGQPAAAAYLREPDGVLRAHGVQVLTVRDEAITRIDTFLDPALFAAFGLPATG
jgi:RNA polymerase sigma-70 factor, ECF subfamily